MFTTTTLNSQVQDKVGAYTSHLSNSNSLGQLPTGRQLRRTDSQVKAEACRRRYLSSAGLFPQQSHSSYEISGKLSANSTVKDDRSASLSDDETYEDFSFSEPVTSPEGELHRDFNLMTSPGMIPYLSTSDGGFFKGAAESQQSSIDLRAQCDAFHNDFSPMNLPGSVIPDLPTASRGLTPIHEDSEPQREPSSKSVVPSIATPLATKVDDVSIPDTCEIKSSPRGKCCIL